MKSFHRDIFINLDSPTSAFVLSKGDNTSEEYSFIQGDTLEVRIHLRSDYRTEDSENVSNYYQLDQKSKIVFALKNSDDPYGDYLSYIDEWDEKMDEDGDIMYVGTLLLNTDAAQRLAEEQGNVDLILELAIVEQAMGGQITFLGQGTMARSVIPSALIGDFKPSINVGTYSSVVSLANGIVDQRILDLRAGAPAEFDTLYELAHYAQKVRSHEIVVGDFCDYLDGKKLADQNLTVVSLGNIMIDSSTYVVSHEPWRPKEVTAGIAE
jgi:hypothetical protein